MRVSLDLSGTWGNWSSNVLILVRRIIGLAHHALCNCLLATICVLEEGMLVDPDIHRLPLTVWCLILSSWRLLRLLGVKALLCWVCGHRLCGGLYLIWANWILRIWHHGDFVHIEHLLFEVALLLWNLSKPPISNQATFQETSFDGSLSDSWGRPLRARCTRLIHVDLGAGVYPVELVLERAIASFDNGHLSQVLLLGHDLFLQLALDNRHLHHLLLALL